jgi:Protein of unknown function (DUF4229)
VSDAQPAGDGTTGDPAGSGPSFGKSLGLFWLYTLLRFGLFGLIWLILWVVGVGWLFAAAIAVVLSVPLSWVLLSRPRMAFAANIEQRVNARFERKAEFDAQLQGDPGTAEDADDDADEHADRDAGRDADR